jgi:hypothetical protein
MAIYITIIYGIVVVGRGIEKEESLFLQNKRSR